MRNDFAISRRDFAITKEREIFAAIGHQNGTRESLVGKVECNSKG